MSMGYYESLITSQVDGPTLTAAAAASCIPPAAIKTLPANFFDVIGKKLIIEMSGRVSSVITTPGTMRFDVRLGGTVVFDSLAVLLETAAGYTTVGWKLRIEMICRAIGAAANLMGQGTLASVNLLGVPGTPPKPAITAILPWNSAPAVGGNFSSVVAQQLDVFFTQTAATGSLTVHEYEAASPTFYPA